MVDHSRTGHYVTDAQELLRRNPFIRDNTHNCRHEDRDDALNGIEHPYPLPESYTGQVPSLAGQISSPDRKL